MPYLMVVTTVTKLMPLGTDGIIKKIRETVGDGPVYLSIDVRAVAVTFDTLPKLINYN
jgi:arginase family enzyme